MFKNIFKYIQFKINIFLKLKFIKDKSSIIFFQKGVFFNRNLVKSDNL